MITTIALQVDHVFSPVVFCRLMFSFFAAVLFGVITNGEAIAAAANEANGQRITHVHHPAAQHHNFTLFDVEDLPHCHFVMQDNFSAVPKRVWADVVRKLGTNMNSRNAAADLYVPARFVHASNSCAHAFRLQPVRLLHTTWVSELRLCLAIR